MLQRGRSEAGQLNLLLLGLAPFISGLRHVNPFGVHGLIHEKWLVLLDIVWGLRMFHSRTVHLAFTSDVCVVEVKHRQCSC